MITRSRAGYGLSVDRARKFSIANDVALIDGGLRWVEAVAANRFGACRKSEWVIGDVVGPWMWVWWGLRGGADRCRRFGRLGQIINFAFEYDKCCPVGLGMIGVSDVTRLSVTIRSRGGNQIGQLVRDCRAVENRT